MRYLFLLLSLQLVFIAQEAIAAEKLHDAPIAIASLSLEELVDLDITSFSKKPQKVSEAAGAIFVITQEDIRRSGATTVPEVLRLAPGVQVARVTSNAWAISSRGLNSFFTNKLLVLIDGRSVYTPIFAGVYWDAQDTVLEDIERIEVIRGPGASLWGANAVNGIINIITKNSTDTQGGLISGVSGSEEHGIVSARYGDSLGEDDSTTYRVFGKYANHDSQEVDDPFYSSTTNASDRWQTALGGIRLDSQLNETDNLSVIVDASYGQSGFPVLAPTPVTPFSIAQDPTRNYNNQSVNLSWERSLGEESEVIISGYWDRIDRDDSILAHLQNTLDFDAQHRFPVNDAYEIIWGLNYRTNIVRTDGPGIGSFVPEGFDPEPFTAVVQDTSFRPPDRETQLYSAFIQNEFSLSEEVTLTLGTKLEHNNLTGFEYQPTARVIWQPDEDHSVWAAFSKAVRTPALNEEDQFGTVAGIPDLMGTPGVNGLVTLTGSRATSAEELLAYEAGYRAKLDETFSFDLAVFFNKYHDLGGDEAGMPEAPVLVAGFPVVVLPTTIASNRRGESIGGELVLNYRPNDKLRFTGTYSYINVNIKAKNGANPLLPVLEDLSPEHQFQIRSMVNLPFDTEFDSALRYADRLSDGDIDSYFELDLRLAWHLTDDLELSVVGRNLLANSHEEFFADTLSVPQHEIQREVYGRLAWNF